MKDTIVPAIEFVMPAVAFEKAVQDKHGTNVEAVKQILDNEYNEWLEVRDYVRKNMWKLKGKTTSLEVTSLTDISDPYNCVVINDMDMRHYQSIFDEIKEVEEKEEQLKINEALDSGLCPSGCGEVDTHSTGMLVLSPKFLVSGYRCNKCETTWDYDNQVKRLRKLLSEIERKGRTTHG